MMPENTSKPSHLGSRTNRKEYDSDMNPVGVSGERPPLPLFHGSAGLHGTIYETEPSEERS